MLLKLRISVLLVIASSIFTFSVSAIPESHVSSVAASSDKCLEQHPYTHYGKHSEISYSQPIVGAQSLIVILARFPDKPETKTIDYINKMVFSKMNDYFLEVSFGKMWFVGSVLPKWYLLPHEMSYYDPYEIQWNIVQGAINAADNDVDYRQYRYVMIVHSSKGVGWAAHSSQGSRSISTNDGMVQVSLCYLSEFHEFGMFAHETGHMLGLPDLYDYDNKEAFVGRWDLMADGSHNSAPSGLPGSSPAHISACGKIKLGWIDQSQVLKVKPGTSTSVIVEQVEEKTSSFKAVILPITQNQYFLVETRKRVGFDYWAPFESDWIKLLMYYVDETIPSGHGPVRLQDALSPPKTGTTQSGVPTVQNDRYRFAIAVLSATSDSFSLKVDYHGYGLTIRTMIPNVSITCDGEAFSANAAGNVDLRVSYWSRLLTVPQTVPKSLNSRYSFTGWSDGETSPTRLITVQTDMSINVNYKTQHRLTINSQYGTVQGDGWYDEGQSATVAAGDTGGYRFLGWTLDGTAKLGSSITVQMYGPHTLKANYGWPTTFPQNVEVASSSAVSRYFYDAKNRVVSFVVSGDSGTLGFSTVRIPKQLLWSESPTVKIDGQAPLLASINDGGSVWIVSFSYIHSEHLVAIPEFHQLGLMLALALCVVMILSRRAIRRDQVLSRWAS